MKFKLLRTRLSSVSSGHHDGGDVVVVVGKQGSSASGSASGTRRRVLRSCKDRDWHRLCIPYPLPHLKSYPMPPSGIPAKRVLPSKEASLFRELLNLYETRQLKKGQKTADQILKKFPEHGGRLKAS